MIALRSYKNWKMEYFSRT